MKRKDLITHFESQNKKLFLNCSFKSIHPVAIGILISLSAVDVLKYYRISPEYIAASSEMLGRKIVTSPNHKTAVGVRLIFHPQCNIVDFFEINSPKPGYGGRMVEAVINSLPERWSAVVLMDYSSGFWNKMKERYDKLEIA